MSVSLVKRPSTAVLVALDLVRERDPVTAQYLEDAVVVAAMTALLNREIEFRSTDWGPDLNEHYREPIFRTAVRTVTCERRSLPIDAPSNDTDLHQVLLTGDGEKEVLRQFRERLFTPRRGEKTP